MIETELLAYKLAFFITWCAFIVMMLVVLVDGSVRKQLRKDGILKTKRGTYTFTPNEGYKE